MFSGTSFMHTCVWVSHLTIVFDQPYGLLLSAFFLVCWYWTAYALLVLFKSTIMRSCIWCLVVAWKCSSSQVFLDVLFWSTFVVFGKCWSYSVCYTFCFVGSVKQFMLAYIKFVLRNISIFLSGNTFGIVTFRMPLVLFLV